MALLLLNFMSMLQPESVYAEVGSSIDSSVNGMDI